MKLKTLLSLQSSLRVTFLVGRIVHLPAMKREVRAFYGSISKGDAAHVDAAWLAMFFSILLVAISHPPRDWKGLESWTTVENEQRWYKASLECLTLHGASLLYSKEDALRATVLLDFYEPNPQQRLVRLRASISNAHILGLHHENNNERSFLQREMRRRLWWALVVRDWLGALENGTNVIQKSQMTTLPPENVCVSETRGAIVLLILHFSNDDHLEVTSTPTVLSAEQFTDMSFVLGIISLAQVSYDHAQIQYRERNIGNEDAIILNERYLNVLESMPSIYHEADMYGEATNMGSPLLVHLWFIKQSAFNKYISCLLENFNELTFIEAC